MDNNNGLNVLDAISIVSLFIGLANYNENVDQSKMNDAIHEAVEDIHRHLAVQDEKLEAIYAMLKV